MRSWKFVVPVLVIVLFASSALAAGSSMSSSSTSSGNWTFGIQGGASVPTSDYGSDFSAGWNIGGQADYWLNPQWGLGVDAGYHSTNAKDEFNNTTFGSTTTPADGKTDFLQYGVHAVYMIPMQGAQVHPYLQGGVGGYNVKIKVDNATKPTTESIDESKNKFGFNVGAGVDFHATNVVNLGINGTYHYVSGTDDIVPSAQVPSGFSFPSNNSWFGIQGRVTFMIPVSGK